MSLLDFFRRKNYASPYYGGTGALFQGSAVPLRQDPEPEPERKQVLDISQVRIPCPRPNALDWEQRRFELAWKIALQERRSVVLGKLKATDKQIASKARCLSDAIIKELQTHQFKSDDDEGRTENDE